MKIHTLPGDPGRQQKRKRVGRGEGSGHGKTAGKGNKGAKARSGYKTRPYFEGGQMPLIRRLPKFGFTNPNRVEYVVVNLAELEDRFEAGATVDVKALKDKKIVRGRQLVKVLGDGTLSKKLTVRVHAFSKSAREKIEAAGGTVEVVEAAPAESTADET